MTTSLAGRQLWIVGRERLASLHGAIRKIAPWTIEHLLFVGGLGLVAYGASLVYRPFGFILGGWFAMKLAILISAERR